MTVTELKALLDDKHPIQILDVREMDEFQYANIGGVHIPLGDLTQRTQELDANKEWVVICHHGGRSAHAVAYLRSTGFTNVHNLSGGIEAWSLEVDSSVPRY